jgi:hypothetical protein
VSFQAGDRVRVKPDVMPRLLVAYQKRLNGRVGVVKGTYTSLGSNVERARVQWLRKTGASPVGEIDHWPIRDLELAP